MAQLQNGLNNWRSDLGQEGINAVWDLFMIMDIGGDSSQDVTARVQFVEDQLRDKHFLYAEPDVSLAIPVRVYFVLTDSSSMLDEVGDVSYIRYL